MIPVTFSGMLGKLHLPKGKPSGLGVVIVPPHGLEALAATKSLRLLADACAAAGHAALRYDLPGTADSLGDDGDPDRLTAWQGSIPLAAGFLKAHAGTSSIVVAGLRFGAHLAALAAPKVDGLAGLALLDPVVRGRMFARELAIMARAVAEGARLDPDATATDSGLLVGGHLTSTETLAALRDLDLGKVGAPKVPVLILHRRGMADATALASSWRAATPVESHEVQGFESIALSPTMAVTPHAAFARLTEWLDDLPAAPPMPAITAPPARLAGADFTEEAVMFGPDNRLFGIFCDPRRPADGKPALLIVNAGRNPHVGWARANVDLARRLAAAGIASLRIDLGGIGDGIDRPGAADTIESVLYHPETDAEAAAAIDLLAARHQGAVVVSGACSGAYLALRSAAADQRVQGVLLVNIQRFVWRSGETVAEAIASAYPLASSYVSKAFDRRAWTRVLKGERKILPLLREFAKRGLGRLRSLTPSAETRQARALADALTARGARVELLFSENDPGLDDLALHFGASGRLLTQRPKVVLTLVANSDHDLTPAAAREALFQRALAATSGA